MKSENCCAGGVAELLKKKKITTRVGHRSHVTKTIGDIEKNEENLDKEERSRINLKSALEEQYQAIKALDNEILDLLTKKESVEDEEISAEMKETGRLRADIKTAITSLQELLRTNSGLSNRGATQNTLTHSQVTRVIREKLPKLEVSKFNGRPEEWQELWDGFENSVHANPN